MSRKQLTRWADAGGSWLRVPVIIGLVVVNGVWEELLIQRAEAMMLIRWFRDVVRYDLRWMVQEHCRRIFRRDGPVNQQ